MIGLFGGTFDPVHFGHLRAACEVRETLGIDDFRLLPAAMPPHRERTWSTVTQRLEMLQLAVSGHPDLRIDERELHRSGPSWMVDTLLDIRTEEPQAPLLLIIGQDSANQLDHWHRWQQLFELAHVVVMQRPGASRDYRAVLAAEIKLREVSQSEDLAARACGAVMHLQISQQDISSTVLRRMIREGKSPRFLLPDPVLAYLYKHGLYRD
jgi:nicotinate-nucleotide adenylyltransferase